MADARRLDFIHSMRGIASLMVVLCHARWFFLGTPQADFAHQLLYPGGAGVDVFFVISGFVMVYATRDSDGSFRYSAEFLIKRFAKIWLPYAVIGLLYFYLVRGFAAFNLDNAEFILKSLIFIPPNVHDPFYFGSGLTPVAWSLNYEFYFYLVFAGSMLFRRLRWIAIALWLGTFLYAVPVHYRGFFSFLPLSTIPTDSAYFQMMTNPIIAEFIAGMVIGLVYRSPIKVPNSSLCRLLVFLALSICVWAWIGNVSAVNSLAYWGTFAVLAMATLAICSKTLAMKQPPVLMWLGNISYSLYLVHPLVNFLTNSYFQSIGLKEMTQTWAHVVLTTSISLTAATLSYWILEKWAHDVFRNAMLRSFRHLLNRGTAGADPRPLPA